MADVPFATNLLGSIDSLIANAPGAMLPGQAIGNLPDAYWAGQNQAYQQRNRNLFQNGIPPDIGTALLKAAGAAGVPEYIALEKLKAGADLMGPIPGETVPYAGTASGQVARAQPAQQASQTPSQPAGTATLRDIATAQNIPIDQAMALARSTNPDAPLNFDQRKTMVAALTGGATEPTTFAGRFPGAPEGVSTISAPPMQIPPSVGSPNPARPQPQPAQAPAQVAQAQPGVIAQPQAGPSVDEQVGEMNRQRQIADEAFRRARIASGKGLDAEAKILNERGVQANNVANDINKSLLERAMPTHGQREARDPAVAASRRAEEIQKLKDAQAQRVFSGIQAQASQYERDLKPYTDLGMSILSDPRTYTGIGANAVLDFNKVKANFGAPQAAMMQEAVQKLNAASVLSQINTQKDQMQEAGSNSSRLFSSQVEQVEKASANMGNTIYGNRFLLNVQQHMGETASEIARQARAYRAKYGVLDDNFDEQISNYLQKHPVFTDLERARPDVLGAPQVPPGAKDWSKEQAAAWGREHGLKAGEVARIGVGKYLTIPRIDVYRAQ